MFTFSKILTLLGSFLLTATYRRKGQQVETACLYVQHSARFQSRNPLILPQPASESRQGCPGAPHPLTGRSEGWRPCDGPGLGPEALLASARCRGNVSAARGSELHTRLLPTQDVFLFLWLSHHWLLLPPRNSVS